jgi:hypothetical protein
MGTGPVGQTVMTALGAPILNEGTRFCTVCGEPTASAPRPGQSSAETADAIPGQWPATPRRRIGRNRSAVWVVAVVVAGVV